MDTVERDGDGAEVLDPHIDELRVQCRWFEASANRWLATKGTDDFLRLRRSVLALKIQLRRVEETIGTNAGSSYEM